MNERPDKSAGTLDQEGGDAVVESPTTGTPDAEQSRDAESEEHTLDYWKGMALAYKDKVERVNDQDREADLEGGAPQPPVAASPEVQDKTEQIEDLLAKAAEFEKRGDPVAALGLRTEARVAKLERDGFLKEQLAEMPREVRSKVIAHFNKHWRRLGDMNAALAEVEAPELKKRLAEAEKRLALLEKPPDEDVMRAPPTHGREISARQTNKKLSEAQFDANAQSIRASKGELAYLKYVKENAGNVQ